MSNTRYDKPEIDLSHLIPYKYFRTVESFDMIKAPKEVPVRLQLKKNFMDKLTFVLPWDGDVLGYARRTNALDELCKLTKIEIENLTIYLNDWDDCFQLTLEAAVNKKETYFFVKSEDVREMLENCCRIPSQQILK